MHLIKKLYHAIPNPIRRRRYLAQEWLRNSYWLFNSSLHDAIRMARYSSALKTQGTQDNQKAKLLFYSHKIEKAMSLPSPRLGFGQPWIKLDFIPILKNYYSKYGNDDIVSTCYISLLAYLDFNRELGSDFQDTSNVITNALSLIEKPLPHILAGFKQVSTCEIKNACLVDFDKFTSVRHSIRNFTQATVEKSLIENAIKIAQRTPSVCNRQPWHVYGFANQPIISRALKHQNGNAGFDENIHMLVVITGDLSAMINCSERNEIWIDGGMFSMSLVYALHSMGLGTCCLNLCHNAADAQLMRNELKIADHHSPIMMIAIGHISETLNVAHSQRKSICDILTWD